MYMADAFEKNKTFNYFEELPQDVGRMVVGQMSAIERCRFSGCSKWSNFEAKSSKKYVVGLEINNFHEDAIVIKVLHGYENGERHGYSLVFHESNGKKLMECMTLYCDKLWLDELDVSTNLLNYACQYFKNLLRSYQSSLKKLWINANIFERDFDFGIEKLKSLKELGIWSRFLPQFLPYLRYPLENLNVYGEANPEYLENNEMIFQVTNQLSVPQAKCNMEQVLQLAAKYAQLHIGQITEKEVTLFIRSWKNGTRDYEFNQLSWSLTNSTFNTQTLMKNLVFLGAKKSPYGYYELEQRHDAAKKVLIFVKNESLTFEWNVKNLYD